ncbi:CAP domain-containing protein [Lacinutrix sp. C3R15]|uniref:CAP domain-containing protein n=1 Tax=Flavobacteriaceae TaxID=49546 RepID=UPI001C09EFFA|nr:MULTISPECIES: CAP domain-containing protein [Flavobacteriaceae]MBU2938173.1 CAP domain-containing protein [Lacinutrix sp. C3R15]MDO6621487.1 CAP domain-containing protein [Oceanihabitans sp. 1_MG-2023]
MKKIVIVAVFLLSAFLTSCSVEETSNTEKAFSAETIQVEYTILDYEIAELINAHRISIGINALNIIDHASFEAITHNQYMVDQGELSHDNFSLRSQNLQEAVHAIKVSENVGYGYSSAASLVNAWLQSEGHRETIENTTFTDFGISSKKDEAGKDYVTNIFIKL